MVIIQHGNNNKDPLHLFVQHLIWEMMYRDEDEDKVHMGIGFLGKWLEFLVSW